MNGRNSSVSLVSLQPSPRVGFCAQCASMSNPEEEDGGRTSSPPPHCSIVVERHDAPGVDSPAQAHLGHLHMLVSAGSRQSRCVPRVKDLQSVRVSGLDCRAGLEWSENLTGANSWSLLQHYTRLGVSIRPAQTDIYLQGIWEASWLSSFASLVARGGRRRGRPGLR